MLIFSLNQQNLPKISREVTIQTFRASVNKGDQSEMLFLPQRNGVSAQLPSKQKAFGVEYIDVVRVSVLDECLLVELSTIVCSVFVNSMIHDMRMHFPLMYL